MLWAQSRRFERYAHLQQRAIRAPDHVRLHRPWALDQAAVGASNPAMSLSRLWQIDSRAGLDLPQSAPVAACGPGVR
jgi:hypothetical protein